MNQVLKKVYQQESLTKEEMKGLARQLFNGEFSEAEMGAFLMALKIKGETVDEIAGLAELLQEVATPIPVATENTICNCGTGGDLSNSFNISTTAAFVLAAGGLKVAKTGNRSISSQAGSFDTCEALGINFLLAPAEISQLLTETNLAFIFAPHVHPRMKYIMPTRKALAVPTIMNLIGPLTNPIQLDYQLLGTYRRDLLVTTAEALRSLGRKRGIVVNGANHMDEASLAGENHYALLANGVVSLHSFTPADLGLASYPAEAIRGGNATENATILLSVLKAEPSPYLETVVLNAALGFYAAGRVNDLVAGVAMARAILENGLAYNKLQELLQAQKQFESRGA